MQFFKIKNTISGLYSTGGLSPKFTKNGKTWSKRTYVDQHLNLMRYHSSYHDYDLVSQIYKDCVLITYENGTEFVDKIT